MKGNYNYRFDRSTNIFFKEYYGPITIEGIKSSWIYAYKNKLIPKETKGFIVDYRNATFNMKDEKHVEITDFYKEHPELFGNFKIAVLYGSRKDVFLPGLGETKDEGYSSQSFSTIEAAIQWVLNDQ